MKKLFLFVALFLMVGAVWNSSSASPKPKLAADDGKQYIYDLDQPLINDVSQLSTNSVSLSDCDKATGSLSAALGALIDNDKESLFHSVWDDAMKSTATTAETWAALMDKTDNYVTVGTGYHNLQVSLYAPVSSFYFRYYGRQNATWHDNPSEIQIFATNDDRLAETTDNANTAEWTEIEDYTDDGLKDAVIQNYISKRIDMGASYKYIRFVIKKTVMMNKEGLNRGMVSPEITGVTWNASEFQLYEALEVTNPIDKLKSLVDSISLVSESYDFTATGTGPGWYSTEKVDAYLNAQSTAKQYLSESHTDEEYITAANEYRNAFKAAIIPNPVKDGYYYIYSAYSPFKENQPKVQKAMYALEGGLNWKDLEKINSTFCFHITALTDSTFSIQNVATKGYINTVKGGKDANDTQIATSETQENAQYLTRIGNGRFRINDNVIIAGMGKTYGYNAQGNNSGNGANGTVCRWTSDGNGEAAWILNEITDKDTLSLLIDRAEAWITATAMADAISNGTTTRSNANDYDKLITNADQITSNAQSSGDGSSYANLIDGNTETIFHSVWNAGFKTSPIDPAISYGWHNLQFKMPRAVSKIKFNYTGRNSDGWADSPNHITIYGTNVDTLGAKTAAADSVSWTELADLTKDFPKNVALSKYASPLIDLNGSYKYLRFVVKSTTNQNIPSERTFIDPFTSGVTFNLSEIQVYDGTPGSLSQYYKVAGMKEACDALDALLTDGQTKLDNMTCTQADVDAINAATLAVSKLFVNRDSFDTVMKTVLDSANKLYNIVIPTAEEKLITSASQLSTNSSSNGDGSSFANLIDGNNTTNFHSHWDTAMQSATITEDAWTANQEAWVKSDAKNIAVGTGYHNLQVKLNEPTSKFRFYYLGRGNTDWHDNPNHIKIFATNDDALGASVNAAESASWTEIKDMVLDTSMVKDVKGAEYTSPYIDMGASYKYIRFVILNTTHKDKVDTRVFGNPDVTGITWNVMEWQMYKESNQNKFQYNYVTGMKEAVDAMKAAYDTYIPYVTHSTVSDEPVNAMRALVNKVRSLYADSTDLAALYARYKTNVDSSVVAEGIGFVDAQAPIDEFRAAINAAKATVDATQPTVETINAAIASMNTAYATFMPHVGQITPNQWYSIVSGSTRAVMANQPIFLNSTSVGGQLKISGYPIETVDPKGDPYAVFRFVPVEGQDGQFFIQNLGTGQYFGAYRGDAAENSPLMSHEKAAYRLMYFGNGKFKMIQANVKNDMDALKTDGANSLVLNYPLNNDNQQTWKFNAVSSEQEMLFNSMSDNYITVMTLPFATKGDLSLMMLNEGVVSTYAIQSMNVTETGTELNLVLQNDFEAGEPFIMTVNDYTLYDAAAAKCPISLAIPESVTDTSSIVANGLIGTLQGMTLNKKGMGIFTSAALTATTDKATTIAGRAGYINPTMVTTKEGTPDLTITIGDIINSAKPDAVVTGNEKVNLYTSDGVLLKKDVKANQAPSNLQKGIYILGKKKITVK